MNTSSDRRNSDAGPGTHLLVVGVSAYRHLPGGSGPPARETLGMRPPSSAATSAFRVHRNLVGRAQFAVPVASSGLLLSPTAEERSREPEMAEVPPATLSNFLEAAEEWRRRTATHPDNVALLYVVGLGLERENAGQVFLLEDFGDGVGPLFRNAVTLTSIYQGMAPTSWQPNMARTQLFVFDASRVAVPPKLELQWARATPVFDADPPLIDDRAAVTLFSAPPGGAALSQKRGGSLFSQALLRCLDGAAATRIDADDGPRWVITVSSLVEGLQREVERLSDSIDRKVAFDFGGSLRDATLLELSEAPSVELQITIEPHDAAEATRIELTDEEGTLAWGEGPPLSGNPVVAHMRAGLYRLSVSVEPARADLMAPTVRWRPVMPPVVRWVVDLLPQ